MQMKRWMWVMVGAAGLAVLAGCGDDDGDGGEGGSGGGTTTTTTTTTGNGGGGGMAATAEAYYSGPESAMLGAAGNQATCSTCHSNDGSQAGYSGNTFQDIAYHTSYKGGMAPTLLDASNACITGWMGGEALVETDEAWMMLRDYMESISDSSATAPNALQPEVLADAAAYEAAYMGGDAAAGAAAYATSCAKCHDAGLTVGPTTALPKEVLATYTIGRIAQKVRTSGPPPSDMSGGPDTTPGPMPFFEVKDLSQQDLANIIAHVLGN